MQKQFECLDAALELAKRGIAVYPTIKGKKMPFKGSHAQKDASSDPERVFDMFSDHPEADVSIRLDGLIVLDIDNHQGNMEGLASLSKANIHVESDTRIEATPNNGLHLFYHYQGEKFNHLDLMPGVEVRGDQIKVAPSAGYTVKRNNPVQSVPEWLLKLIIDNLKPKYHASSSYVPGSITFLGKKVNELMDGADEGERNVWLSKQIGFLLGQGVTPSKTYELMQWITQTKLSGREPIRKSEFDATFRSVFKLEKSKLGGAANG